MSLIKYINLLKDIIHHNKLYHTLIIFIFHILLTFIYYEKLAVISGGPMLLTVMAPQPSASNAMQGSRRAAIPSRFQ